MQAVRLVVLLLFSLPILVGGSQVSHTGAIGGKAHGNGNNCSAGEIALGVDADGAVEGCYEPTEADITDLAHTATAIQDGLIVEADLDEDSGSPTDGDVLTFDSTGSNFNWIAQSAVAATETNSLATTITGIAVNEMVIGDDTDSAVYSEIIGCAATQKPSYNNSTQVWSCINDNTCSNSTCAVAAGDSITTTGLFWAELFPTFAGRLLVGTGNFTAAWLDMSGDGSLDASGVLTLGAGVIEETMMAANSVDSDSYVDGSVDPVHLANLTKSMWWGAGALSADGTNCAKAVEVTINSGPKLWSIICADNDASIIHGSTVMPDGWNAGTVTFELNYIQTAADTSALNADVKAQCRNATTTVNSTYGSEVAIDDAAVTGSNAIDATTSGAVTADGTCAAGDLLVWQVAIDATGTTTAMATLNILGAKMEWTWNADDA